MRPNTEISWTAAGFEQVDVEPTRIYRAADAREAFAEAGIDADTIAPEVDGKFISAFVRAVKPASSQRVLLRSDLLQTERNTSGALQRPLSLYGQFRAIHHGEAIFNEKGRPNFAAYSAGSHPTGECDRKQ